MIGPFISTPEILVMKIISKNIFLLFLIKQKDCKPILFTITLLKQRLRQELAQLQLKLKSTEDLKR